jgi:hypothetical protein
MSDWKNQENWIGLMHCRLKSVQHLGGIPVNVFHSIALFGIEWQLACFIADDHIGVMRVGRALPENLRIPSLSRPNVRLAMSSTISL